MILRKNHIIITLFLILTIGFYFIFKYNNFNNNITEEIYTINQPTGNLETLKYKILYEGDSKAYMELYNLIIVDEMKPDEFLYWALIWANKYNKPEGYFDVYECIVSTCYINNSKNIINQDTFLSCNIEIKNVKYFNHDIIDKSSLELAMRYLRIAAEMGNYNAIEELKRFD